MSVVFEATQVATQFDTTIVAAHLAAGGDGIFDLINTKSKEAMVSIRSVAVLIVVFMVLMRAVKTQFAVAAITIAIVVGGAVLWAVFNITSVQDRVDNELNSAPAYMVAAPFSSSS